MKTIIDAVNELRGDLNNVSYIKGDDTYHCNVNYNADSGWWCSRGVYGDFVCAIDDFEGEVSSMSLSYVRFDTINLRSYILADKELLQPEPELVDGGLYLFDVGLEVELVGEAYLSDFAEKWMINALKTNLNYMVNHCTNIQLLTVGDK
jgi:hypothetical protein